jgi:multidrug transporter EmrE-like cation transporter
VACANNRSLSIRFITLCNLSYSHYTEDMTLNAPILILVGSQLLFTSSDLIGRYYMTRQGFTASAFISLWFLFYIFIRTLATFGQLYVFSSVELGKSVALFGAVSIILANVLGFLVLKEMLSPAAYIGVTLAVIAFIVLVLS